jgi:hypothetical protein
MESRRTTITATTAQQLPDICTEELRDLENAARRPLSQAQAQRYRLRQLKNQLVAKMLDGSGR